MQVVTDVHKYTTDLFNHNPHSFDLPWHTFKRVQSVASAPFSLISHAPVHVESAGVYRHAPPSFKYSQNVDAAVGLNQDESLKNAGWLHWIPSVSSYSGLHGETHGLKCWHFAFCTMAKASSKSD